MDQQGQEEDKKTKLVEKAASVPSSSSSSSSETLRSLSNELAELYIDDDKDERSDEASARAPPPPLPKELIDFDSPVLDHLMRFLDNKSLKMCREVCKSWEKPARMALKKRCDRVDDNNSLPFAQLVCGCPKVCNEVNIQMNYY
jgi:hypothetical protein